jgi:hypothetical protein
MSEDEINLGLNLNGEIIQNTLSTTQNDEEPANSKEEDEA